MEELSQGRRYCTFLRDGSVSYVTLWFLSTPSLILGLLWSELWSECYLAAVLPILRVSSLRPAPGISPGRASGALSTGASVRRAMAVCTVKGSIGWLRAASGHAGQADPTLRMPACPLPKRTRCLPSCLPSCLPCHSRCRGLLNRGEPGSPMLPRPSTSGVEARRSLGTTISGRAASGRRRCQHIPRTLDVMIAMAEAGSAGSAHAGGNLQRK